MSLLTEAMTACTMLVRTVTADGYGGYSDGSWTDGTPFEAAVVLDSSMQARRADAETTASLYTVTTSRKRVLRFHDVFRRESDGKIFRVTSNGDDKRTPASAGLDMRQVTAEEWRLPE